MPGSLVTDANAANVLLGATLNAAGTTNSTIVAVDRPGEAIVRLVVGPTVTSTANSATLKVVVSGSDSATFASGVYSYGTINSTGTDALQANSAHQINVSFYHRYVRCSVVLGGTAPVYTGTVAAFQQEDYLRTRTVSAD